jgi:hypothetical protein
MDAYDLSEKMRKYWVALYPKNSGELNKNKSTISVVVNTDEGYRVVAGIKIIDDTRIELTLDKE